jgi:peptide/nickel transport system permease protein
MMLRYILKRFLSALVVLFLFQTAVFFAVQLILPGDYVSQFAMFLSSSETQEFRQLLGLDLPIWERYLNWLQNLLKGDLGHSFSLRGPGPSVFEVLKEVTPPTILVFGVGTALAFLLGLWLGKITGWRRPGIVSGAITFGSITLYTSFPPWLAFLLVYFLSTQLGFLPNLLSHMLWQNAPLTSSQVMLNMVLALLVVIAGLLLVNGLIRRLTRRSLPTLLFLLLAAAVWIASWSLMGIYPYAVNIAQAAALPLIGYVLLSFGEIMLVMRTTMLDVMHEQYVHTARAKGLPDYAVRDRHVARNAILPVLSGLVVRLPYLLTGAVMLERALHWEGVGTELFMAVGLQNILLVMGLVLVIGVISLSARLLLDILQVWLDPRLRTTAGEVRELL